jgi:hypothetical protein
MTRKTRDEVAVSLMRLEELVIGLLPSFKLDSRYRIRTTSTEPKISRPRERGEA